MDKLLVERLETKDLILDKAKMEDVESIFKNYWCSEKTAKYMLWVPQKNLSEARERLQRTINYQKNNLAFFIYDKETCEAIGQVAFVEVEDGIYEDRGLGLGEKFVGRGYGKQVLKLMFDYIFEKLNANKIFCSCHEDNVASAKLQQSCGMVYSHTQSVTREKDNLTYNSLNFVITKEMWQNLN